MTAAKKEHEVKITFDPKSGEWDYRRIAGNGRKVDDDDGFASLEDAQMAAYRGADPDVELEFAIAAPKPG